LTTDKSRRPPPGRPEGRRYEYAGGDALVQADLKVGTTKEGKLVRFFRGDLKVRTTNARSRLTDGVS